MSIVTGQLKTEKNLRIKAVISYVLGKSLSISKESINDLLADAFESEEDEFWKFELLTILLMNTGDKGLGKNALAKYKKTNVLSLEQEELIKKIILQSNFLNFLSNIINSQEKKSKSEEEQNEIKSKKGLFDDILDFFAQSPNLVSQNPKVKLAQLGQHFNLYNQGGIKYDIIIDEIEKLEEQIGELPAFAVSEGLPEDEENSRFEYLIFELLYHGFSSMEIILNHSVSRVPFFNLRKILSGIDTSISRNISNEALVAMYCREWEIQYSNLVKPVFEKLKQQKLLPKKYNKMRKHSYQSQIDGVRGYAEKKMKLNSFNLLLEPLNATLRNSLVHYNYFFDKNGKELVYYRIINGKSKISRISIDSFANKVFLLLVLRNIFTVRIAKKLSKELGIEWKRRY